ncbi:hypothetical protein TWF718_005415 [Orbilia javanica]|uniref:Tetrapyrrole biosynthesis uroporphyrinogen III synthase domain-containing protein n=1 Tax=Orbilia javanica TaxID=47235 RepID=A0AAN8RNW5_9PEZI
MAPILLLKTKSTPTDPYSTLLSSHGYTPIFVPVLHHTSINGDLVREYILNGSITTTHVKINNDNNDNSNTQNGIQKFAAIIITSQRAVEALGAIIDELKPKNPSQITHLLQTTTIYVVGPATRNSLLLLGFTPTNIIGESSGNGAVLSDFIISHYTSNNLQGDLLFLTGETHSTILPTKVPEKLLEEIGREVEVKEVVVYKTGVVEGFESDLKGCLEKLEEEEEIKEPIWLVFFSPTGTDAALRVISSHESASSSPAVKKYKCCSIGPTTRDFMFQKFGRKADAMAKIPSPDGVLAAIQGPGGVIG